MFRREPSTADRIATLEADLDRLRTERLAQIRLREEAVQAHTRAHELRWQAASAIERAEIAVEVLEGQIDAQLEALSELIPRQRKP